MAEKNLTDQELMKLLEEVNYINVVEISEPRTNALRLVIEELTLKRVSQIPTLAPVDGAAPVEHCDGDMRFEVAWDRYDVYQVLNESYDNGDGPSEIWEGNLFRRYNESRYLRFVAEALENIAFLDPKRQHWAVVGQNHIVHVITSCTPRIRMLGGK